MKNIYEAPKAKILALNVDEKLMFEPGTETSGLIDD